LLSQSVSPLVRDRIRVPSGSSPRQLHGERDRRYREGNLPAQEERGEGRMGSRATSALRKRLSLLPRSGRPHARIQLRNGGVPREQPETPPLALSAPDGSRLLG